MGADGDRTRPEPLAVRMVMGPISMTGGSRAFLSIQKPVTAGEARLYLSKHQCGTEQPQG